MEDQLQGSALKRGLKNRHIQLIALGGAMGTGLFSSLARLFYWDTLLAGLLHF